MTGQWLADWSIITLGGGWLAAGVTRALADVVEMVGEWRQRHA